MTALRGLGAALAGAAGGIGEGLVAEAKAARDEMLERMRMAHQSEEAEKSRQLTRDEGQKTRDLTASESEKTRAQQAEQAGATREDARNEGALNREQQAKIANLQIAAQKALKQMEIDADPTKTFVTLDDGSISRPSKDADGNIVLTPVKNADGTTPRKQLAGGWMNVGSDGKIYADGQERPEGVTVTRMTTAAFNALVGERKATAVQEIKNEGALAIQDSKSGVALTKAQIEAATKVYIQGKKSEDVALVRKAISGDKDADRQLKEKGIDVRKEIAAAHDASAERRNDSTNTTKAAIATGKNESNERIAEGDQKTRREVAGAGQRAKLEGDERADYERRLKREAEVEYDNLKPGMIRGLWADDPTGGKSREKWVREYVDREMAKRDGEPAADSSSPASKPGDSKTKVKPLPEGVTQEQAIASAKAAVAQGKNRKAVEDRLREYGIDPGVIDK